MKTREERMYEHLYSNEGRVEQCERICKLEELAQDMRERMLRSAEQHKPIAWGGIYNVTERMIDLGIEVES